MVRVTQHVQSANGGVTTTKPEVVVEVPKDEAIIMTTYRNVDSDEPGVVNGSKGSDAISSPGEGEEILERPLGTSDHVRVIIIGAGASGLNMIRTMRKHLDNFELTVYEKNPEVGGTWYENRYPGCKCDIPSHNYQFSWRPNPTWSAFFAGATEIKQYLQSLTEAEQLMTAIKLSHQIIGAEWSEDEGQWLVRVKNVATGEVFDDHCNFLLNAAGILKSVGSSLGFLGTIRLTLLLL